ncbi:hypothetical protein OAO87_00270 [bacterium]|nr:hypothetical protein [bacterium]
MGVKRRWRGRLDGGGGCSSGWCDGRRLHSGRESGRRRRQRGYSGGSAASVAAAAAPKLFVSGAAAGGAAGAAATAAAGPAAQLSDSWRFARDSRLEPQLTLHARLTPLQRRLPHIHPS